MGTSRASRQHRRLIIVSSIFGLFMLLVLGLFGWLILESLSRREIDRALLETREDASQVAEQLTRAAEEHQGLELVAIVAVEKERLDSELEEKKLVTLVEVLDKDGILIYRKGARTLTLDETGHLTLTPEELSPALQDELAKEPAAEGLAVEEKIGDLGTIRIGIDRLELERRADVLREDLIHRVVWIGAATIAVLLGAYLVVWNLLLRSQRLEEQAAEAERLAYIGTLAAGLAHEIRNPLNALNLNMQMLEEEFRDRADGQGSSQRLMNITRSEIGRLERLVTDFLSYARPRPLERRALPAVHLLEEAAAVLAGEFEQRGARVEIEDRSGGARVSVDGAQMRQLLLNLLSNALAAVEDAGRKPELQLSVEAPDAEHVVLEVADNGTGMSAEEQAKMFDLFYSTRKGGTGLGLAVVQRIAQVHAGELSVESRPGEGTRIRLRLPAVPSEASRPARDSRPEVRPASQPA